ncbi:MAG TPA: DinB family protein [Thermoanaerobaculaceae bacterium]|nr:DinB family protein [Thermoanaerobaculaceae bacterium]
MAHRRGSDAIKVLTDLLDEGFDAPAWHGPNLRGALKGLTASQAARRPAPGRHCIWEIALHCAYWKYAVRRRLTGEGARGSFPRRPSNWPRLPERPDTAAWRADLALLDESHRLLRAAVASFPARRLGERHGRSTAGRLIYGIAAHDLYHAGQVRLLIKLLGAKS